MLTIGNPNAEPDRFTRRSALRLTGSLVAHALVLLLIAAALHQHPRHVAPFRLPGSPNGHNFLVAYLPDRAAEQSAATKAKPEPKPADAKSPLPTIRVEATTASPLPSVTTPASPNPNSTTGADALGSGNITIALTRYFPPPHPDLTVLPHGTRGDVILDVIIDTNGKISDIKMTSGLGHGIDELVIATVQQWVFQPALQNGLPVASEQELHFHYERG